MFIHSFTLISYLQAGLNHIHLLPLYDFGSVPERVEEQLTVKVRGCFIIMFRFAFSTIIVYIMETYQKISMFLSLGCSQNRGLK